MFPRRTLILIALVATIASPVRSAPAAAANFDQSLHDELAKRLIVSQLNIEKMIAQRDKEMNRPPGRNGAMLLLTPKDGRFASVYQIWKMRVYQPPEKEPMDILMIRIAENKAYGLIKVKEVWQVRSTLMPKANMGKLELTELAPDTELKSLLENFEPHRDDVMKTIGPDFYLGPDEGAPDLTPRKAPSAGTDAT